MVSNNLQLKLCLIFIFLNILSIWVCSGQKIVDCEDQRGTKGIGVDTSNKCFVFLPQPDDSKIPPLNFIAAQQMCSFRGFKLAEINNFGENIAVSAHLLREYKLKKPVDYRSNFIIAAKESEGGDFQYIDGRPLLQQGCSGVPFTKFIDSNKEMTPEKCIKACKDQGYMYASVKENGYKPDNYTDCYCDNTFDRSSLQKCSKRCTELSGKVNEYDYFCGSSDRDVSAIFRTDGIYSIFAYNQPTFNPNQDDRSSHNCILLRADDQRYDDQECFKPERSSLCELTNVDEAGCKSKTYTWINSVKKCINFDRKLVNNWFEARDSCYSHGGDLVVIDSKEFYTKIAELHKNSYNGYLFWIGASNRQYTWSTTNTPIIFSKFQKSTRFSTKENCFALDISLEDSGVFSWIDIDCDKMDANNGVLCMSEIAKSTTPKPTTKLPTTPTVKLTSKPTDKPDKSTTDKVVIKTTKKPDETTDKKTSAGSEIPISPVTVTKGTSKPSTDKTVGPTISTISTSQPILVVSNIKDSADLELDIGVIIVICLAIAAIIGGFMRILAYVLIAKTTDEDKFVSREDTTLELQDQTNNVNYFQNQIVQNGINHEEKGVKNEQFNY